MFPSNPGILEASSSAEVLSDLYGWHLEGDSLREPAPQNL